MVDTASTQSAAAGGSHSLLKRGANLARSLVLHPRCVSTSSLDTCEKPASSSGVILGILIAVGYVLISIVGFFIVLGVLYILHRRGQAREKSEFANDPHELSDYGLDDPPAGKKGGKRGGENLGVPNVKQHRLSAQELLDASNPFGNGAELADSDRVSSRGSPPKYPGDAHVKA
ncbi:hypothetical protein BD289DRAFT_377906 [Coniella lustricola]|uniref:Uncharacterized protein n=1 Tax=Coniella lustricola TaxID=2025994 RepID=A0A2T2ZUT3_9PEZI|nr:hypothetical protein BD289DRAFT_377906 [Coniella lustricola]